MRPTSHHFHDSYGYSDQLVLTVLPPLGQTLPKARLAPTCVAKDDLLQLAPIWGITGMYHHAGTVSVSLGTHGTVASSVSCLWLCRVTRSDCDRKGTTWQGGWVLLVQRTTLSCQKPGLTMRRTDQELHCGCRSKVGDVWVLPRGRQSLA